MESLIGGAVLGAVVGELLKKIMDVKDKISNCKAYLERLESTLKSVLPRIEEIKRLDGELTDSRRTDLNQLIDQLQQGKELTRKCTKLRAWNYYKKYRYSKKFVKLDISLRSFFNLEMQAEILCDTKQILVEIKKGTRKLDELNQAGNGIVAVIANDSCSAVPELPSLVVGLSVPLEELKSQLFQEGVAVVGLCAPGGCGKTTLAAKLCRDETVKAKFKEKIFFLTVSSSPNLKVIMLRLWEQLVGSHCMNGFQNEEDAAKQLRHVLKKMEPEPILVVLDDVWSNSVLDKLTFRTLGYKTLVTSRIAFKSFDSIYCLKMLSERDAMTLFCHSAFPEEGNYEKPDENLVNQIVKGCKGFPLALKVIGQSLHQEPARKWRSLEKKLSRGSPIFDIHKDLLDRLATSLDFLDHTVLQCFLDLGTFPEDKRISAAALIDMWVELYDLDEDDAYVNLLELADRSLVNLVESARKDAGEIDGSFNGLFVTQHDLLRELAIHHSQGSNLTENKRLIINQRENVPLETWKEHKNQVFEAQIVSIHTGKLDSLSWSKMQFPKAEILILNFSAKNYCLLPFLEKMEKLKVLIIRNQSPDQAKLTGFPRFGSLPNLRRIRLEKISILSLDEIKDPLKNLQKLSLVLCEVGEAMSNSALKYSDIFPNLTEIDFDYCGDLVELPTVICEISSLQKLSITNCHDLFKLPEKIDQLKDLQVLRLHGCTRLEDMPDEICGLEKLRLVDISDCLNIERFPEGLGEIHSLRKLDMRQCSRLRRLPGSAKELQHLKDVVCDEETACLWEPLRRSLSELQIHVWKENVNLDWLENDIF